jgi:catechol 2,3-dioxygenase-like lactoylglutathione lyase family enzyme
MLTIKSIHHIKLTVSDLSKSLAFYSLLPGFKLVADKPHFKMFYNGHFYLGLYDHEGNQKEKRFDERNVGMDHVAFAVLSEKDLEEAVKFFDEHSIPHGEIEKLSNGTHILSFRDPDNIQLELAFRSH